MTHSLRAFAMALTICSLVSASACVINSDDGDDAADSSEGGTNPSRMCDAAVVSTPLVQKRSLTATGTPSIAPTSPFARRALQKKAKCASIHTAEIVGGIKRARSNPAESILVR